MDRRRLLLDALASALLVAVPTQIAAILRGASPATLPFELPDATELLVNRATASKLGIRIPQEVLILATEVVG